MSQFNKLSADAFARMLAAELSRYYTTQGRPGQRLFYFEGQDPFGQDSPASAIKSLYWSLSSLEQRDKMAEGFLDLLSTRLELLPPEALVQVVAAIGLIQRDDLLVPMVRVIGQRGESHAELRAVHVAAVMVLKGLAPKRASLNAARELAGFGRGFPDDLVYELLDVLIRDPFVRWSASVRELEQRMNDDYKPDEYLRIKTRLSHTAREIACCVSIKEVAAGLSELIDGDVEGLIAHRLVPRRDPVGMLLAELVLEPECPYEVTGGPARVRLRTKDRKSSCVIPAEFARLGGVPEVDFGWNPYGQPAVCEPVC